MNDSGRPYLREGSVAERLVKGFGYPFSSLLYVLNRPVLWSYAFLPVLITACALALILFGLFAWGSQLTLWIWTPGEEWYWLLLWYPLHVVVLVLLFAIGAVTLPSLVSSPFVEALSRRVEELEIGEKFRERNEASFFRGVLSGLLRELRKIAFLLLVHGLLLLLVIIPVVGQILYPILAWLWTMLWLSAENLELSLSRHQYPFKEGPKRVRGNPALFLGFGSAVFLFLLIPFFNFFFVPLAAVAATRLFLDMEKRGSDLTAAAPEAKD